MDQFRPRSRYHRSGKIIEINSTLPEQIYQIYSKSLSECLREIFKQSSFKLAGSIRVLYGSALSEVYIWATQWSFHQGRYIFIGTYPDLSDSIENFQKMSQVKSFSQLLPRLRLLSVQNIHDYSKIYKLDLSDLPQIHLMDVPDKYRLDLTFNSQKSTSEFGFYELNREVPDRHHWEIRQESQYLNVLEPTDLRDETDLYSILLEGRVTLEKF